MTKFSLIIPCYNEAANLPALVERCAHLVEHTDCEVILVDNGSTDGTSAALEGLLMSLPLIRSIRIDVNNGYGNGILEGLKVANGDVLAWTHADLQTDPCDVMAGMKFFETNDASVFVKGKRYGRPFLDIIFTALMGVFETLLMQRFLWDINAQPTMFTKQFFYTWDDAPSDFSLDLYAYVKAYDAKLDIKRFPVFFGSRVHGKSHWNFSLASKIRFIKRTIFYSLRLRARLNRSGRK